MRIIGIDPGLQRTGWGVVDFELGSPKHVANGICKSNSSKPLAVRLAEIFSQLDDVLTTYKPDIAAVENTFVNKDAAGALKLGQARGMALLAPARLGITVHEYAPNVIKKAVVGSGHAEKLQVEEMVKIQLPGVVIEGVDSADALGVALCHVFKGQFENRVKEALSKSENKNDW